MDKWTGDRRRCNPSVRTDDSWDEKGRRLSLIKEGFEIPFFQTNRVLPVKWVRYREI